MGESLRALALIFTKPLIMAGKYSDTHVFPLFLDAASVTVASGNLDVTTSFCKLEPATDGVAFTLPDGTIPGQVMVCFNNTASNDADITVTTPLDSDAASVSLDTLGTSCSFIWTGSAWAVLGAVGATSAT